MTCLEKLAIDHPDWGYDDFFRALDGECPNHYGYLETPLDNHGRYLCPMYKCIKCWNRTVPGTPDISDHIKALNIVYSIKELKTE